MRFLLDTPATRRSGRSFHRGDRVGLRLHSRDARSEPRRCLLASDSDALSAADPTQTSSWDILGTMSSETVVFRSGNSLAVRLVGDCRLPRGQRVRLRREGERIVLEPVPDTGRQSSWTLPEHGPGRCPGPTSTKNCAGRVRAEPRSSATASTPAPPAAAVRKRGPPAACRVRSGGRVYAFPSRRRMAAMAASP